MRGGKKAPVCFRRETKRHGQEGFIVRRNKRRSEDERNRRARARAVSRAPEMRDTQTEYFTYDCKIMTNHEL